jgi:2-amino-4-hydroxy-6-hydroxymethyldihydropteridine diphosphokinase
VARVYVSLGSNLDRQRHIRFALQRLTELYGPLTRSEVYESDAVGFDSAPFYNLVVGFDTGQSPRQVQEALHAIEAGSGRLRTGELTARTLDLDLLLYDDVVVSEAGLELPRGDNTR